MQSQRYIADTIVTCDANHRVFSPGVIDIEDSKIVWVGNLGDEEKTNNMPTDIIDQAKKSFFERLAKIDWNIYYNDIPFNESALSLYKWAPISDELKELDRKIVLNSVILKWDVVKKEFNERIEF